MMLHEMKSIKKNANLQKHKARVLANGYAQQYNIDFEETIYPLAGFEF